MKGKRGIALDIGTHTGWAVLYPDGSVESGVCDFSTKRGESRNMKLLRFENWADETIGILKPDLVYYELPHHQGGSATMVLVNMAGSIIRACEKHDIPYAGIHTGTLKKNTTGHGKASKEDMVKEAEKRFPGQKITSDDQADALLLLSMLMDILGGRG